MLIFRNPGKLRGASFTLPFFKRTYADISWPPPKIRAQMEIFQRDDGVPVYLKAGFKDRALFGFTCILTAVGMLDGLYTMISMIFPKKKA